MGARVLILGSMPGAASLAAQQYYAHPQNQFWRIIERIYGVPRTLPYPARLEGLTSNRLALWDVLESCVRPGSLDAAIEHASAVPNDAHRTVARASRTSAGCAAMAPPATGQCNGPSATELARDFPRLDCLQLPSTSPAHAALRFQDKLLAWRRALQPRGGRGRRRGTAPAARAKPRPTGG